MKTGLAVLAAVLLSVPSLMAEPTAQPSASLAKKLDSIIIPHVEFYTANINDTVRDIANYSRHSDPAKKGVEIILLDRGNQVEISIDKRNISVHNVLKRVAEITGARLEYEGQKVILGRPVS
ncbi:MAG: hypothetical protein ACI9OU_001259 [Candidatus Promineifilaceae bacterium]|jgi:hypothetical protein